MSSARTAPRSAPGHTHTHTHTHTHPHYPHPHPPPPTHHATPFFFLYKVAPVCCIQCDCHLCDVCDRDTHKGKFAKHERVAVGTPLRDTKCPTHRTQQIVL